MNPEKIKYAYFLGIGGIGMSAIARYLNSSGTKVFGYDKTPSPLTDELIHEGIQITFTDDISTIPNEIINQPDETLLILTPAIPADHQQWNYFKNAGRSIYKRSEVLGLISKNGYSICVAGTHGKTTTTTMIAHMLNTCGINFTAFLGGISANYKTNYLHKTDGKDLFADKPIFVLEADEFDRSFHRLDPDIAVITNTDSDHLDIYGTEAEFKKGFIEFTHKIKQGGHLFLCDGLDLKTEIATTTYGLNKGEAKSDNLIVKENELFFDFTFNGITEKNIHAGIPGTHNVENATAAIAVGQFIGLNISEIKNAVESFRGAHRRFEYVVRKKDYVVIDDYAHHPGELKAIIQSVKQLYPDKVLTGIFQPHLFTRTRDFVDGFAKSLADLDALVLMEIYPARELPLPGINSKWLLDKVNLNNKFLMSENEIINTIKIKKPELLLILGAGDIDRIVPKIKEVYNEC